MRDERNIVLTGFMGTGKTVVGQCVADLTGRVLIDTDERIIKQAGKPIPRIFAEDGEAHFRYIERRVCRFYAGQRGLVISTGGGMLVDDQNRQNMTASGFVVCLNASAETIRQRLEGHTDRPLFAADWEALLTSRLPKYALIPYQVDTDDKTPEEVAEEVLALWQKSLT